MLLISSYLRTPDGNFTPIELYGERPTDPDYVEGAIQIVADGVEIVGKREWDYVDQLWSYLAKMIKDVQALGVASTYYPDQPIKVEFSQRGGRVLISSTDGDKVRRASVDQREFYETFRAAGENFFEKMAQLLPEKAQDYAVAQSELIAR